MKFLVPNYSCLQNPWLGGCRPQIPVICPLSSTEFVDPLPPEKNPGYATAIAQSLYWLSYSGSHVNGKILLKVFLKKYNTKLWELDASGSGRSVVAESWSKRNFGFWKRRRNFPTSQFIFAADSSEELLASVQLQLFYWQISAVECIVKKYGWVISRRCLCLAIT
jgi:hypothetical protein